MTILTPTYTNGQAGPHILAAHEPTREGEQPAPPAAAASPAVAAAPEAGPLKVALIGTAPSSRMLAPYDDKSWQIWACSPGNQNVLPRVDLWFELHSNLLWPEHASYGKPYIEWLNKQSFPIFMQDQGLVPRATPYPMFDMVKIFGRDFFTSSFAWMMAMAIMRGAREIALYGIDMASRNEYILQRPGFYYFRMQAELRGIKVSAPHESDIMQSPPLYAYSESTPLGRKISARETEVTQRVNGMKSQRDGLNHNIAYLDGAMEDLDYFKSIWGGAMDEIVLLKAERDILKDQNAQLLQIARTHGLPAQVEPVAAPPRKRRGRKPKIVVPVVPAEPALEAHPDG